MSIFHLPSSIFHLLGLIVFLSLPQISSGQSQYVTEYSYDIDWEDDGNGDYEPVSGGGHINIKFTGGPTSSTLFVVQISNLQGGWTTYSFSVAPTATFTGTYSIPLHDATVKVSIELELVNQIYIGPPPVNDQYVVGAANGNSLEAIFSSKREANYPDSNNSIVHLVESSPNSATTIHQFPKADGRMFLKSDGFAGISGFGNPPTWHLKINEGTIVPPNWQTIADFWVGDE